MLVDKIRSEKPLILNITNHVTMDFIANGLLSLGASPIMSLAEEESEDLINLANSVVINIGTLNNNFIQLAKKMGVTANQLNKPVIFDPVGAGASQYRTNSALELLDHFKIDIIRGNASEILALSGLDIITKGVDSTADSQHAIDAGQLLSRKYNCAIVISGKTDIVIDQHQINLSHNGSPIMKSITGTGCLLTAVVAAFRAVESNRFKSAIQAAIFYGQCGEFAESKTVVPSHFKNYFLEALHVNAHSTVCA
jgi:hydroxyethylthiazole kinase